MDLERQKEGKKSTPKVGKPRSDLHSKQVNLTTPARNTYKIQRCQHTACVGYSSDLASSSNTSNLESKTQEACVLEPC